MEMTKKPQNTLKISTVNKNKDLKQSKTIFPKKLDVTDSTESVEPFLHFYTNDQYIKKWCQKEHN